MNYYVEQAVLDAGVKIVFAEVCGLDNHGEDPEWAAYRDKRLEELFEAYAELDVHADPILEGFNILHDKTGVKRRKNIPASENLIKHNLVTFKRNSCLAVLGLLERQNEYSTPPFTQKQVVELLDGLRQIAPYVIVDCGSYIANDILSAVALMEADSILRLANCDPKSVNYFASQLPLLDGPEWDMDKQYKVASNVKPYQAADHIGKVLGDTAFVLPYSQELEEQYLAGNLLADLALKDSRPFRKELERIIAEVF